MIKPVSELCVVASLVATLAETDPAAARTEAAAHLARNADVDGAELLMLAVDVGVLRSGFAAYRHFLLNHSRPWDDSGVDRAAADPLTVRQWGRLAAELSALDALYTEALVMVETIDVARHYAAQLGESLHSEALELLGASATSGRFGLDRFQRESFRQRLDKPPRARLADLGRALTDLS